jgi:carboxyl-terminal processing protease
VPRLTIRRAAAALAFAAPVFLGGFALGRASEDSGFRIFQAVFGIVARDALDSLTTDRIYEKAARGIVAGLDDNYASLFSPDEYARFNRNSLGNRYGGLGMRITRTGAWVTVWRVLDGGPAAAAGILRGDRIVAVGDSSAEGWTTDHVSSLLTGEPGTSVRATFERPRSGTRMALTFQRALISTPAVPFSTLLEGGVGYIPLQRFSERSASDVAEAARSLQSQGARSLVLDLRGNPGGSLTQAVTLASLFLQNGQPVVRVRSRREDDTLRATGEPVVRPGEPVAVLIDGNSASASEIVAGALQDYDRALLVGSTSFGKGLVQGAYGLPDGWVLKLTTAHWFTPSGRLIQRTRGDSARTAARPVFHSSGGREILGGGGITPDLAIGGDTLTPPEIAVGRLFGQNAQATNDVLDSYVMELEAQAAQGWTFRPEWRDELVRRLRAGGVAVPDSLVGPAGHYLDRLLDGRLAGFVLPDSAAFVRNAPHDTQLQRALDRLRRARSQQELYALVGGSRPGN